MTSPEELSAAVDDLRIRAVNAEIQLHDRWIEMIDVRDQGSLTENQRGTLDDVISVTSSAQYLFSRIKLLLDAAGDSMLRLLAEVLKPADFIIPPLPDQILTPSGISAVQALGTHLTKSIDSILPRVVDGLENSSLDSNELNRISNQLSNEYTRRYADAAADRAETSAVSAAEASGSVAESELASDFAGFAKRYQQRAVTYQVVALVVGAATIVWAGAVAFDDANDATRLLQKLAVGIPALLIAAYLGREAGFYRSQSAWADTLAVQLKTLRAYVQDLDPEQRGVIRLLLALRTFGPSESMTALDSAHVDVSGLSGLIQRLTPGRKSVPDEEVQ